MATVGLIQAGHGGSDPLRVLPRVTPDDPGAPALMGVVSFLPGCAPVLLIFPCVCHTFPAPPPSPYHRATAGQSHVVKSFGCPVGWRSTSGWHPLRGGGRGGRGGQGGVYPSAASSSLSSFPFPPPSPPLPFPFLLFPPPAHFLLLPLLPQSC